MKIRIRSVLAGAAAFAVATAVMVGGGSPAFAAVTPGWEPDAGALGTVSFYDASGAAVTGGTLSSHPAAWYSVASGPGRAGDNKAQLRVYTPQAGVLPGLWTGDVLTGTTNYPNASAPANIAGLTTPVASGTAGDLSLADYISSFPNTSTAVGYQDLYELRLYTAGPGQGAGATYYRVDIQVNVTGTDAAGLVTGSWNVIYPTPVAPTSTTLSATPASPATSGSAVTLTATVSPATAGAVHFFDGATDLGVATYNAATGVATTSVTPADGVHSFTAQFTSADAGFSGSVSGALSYTVSAAATPTSTTLAATPASPATGDASGNASVAVTATVTPTGLAGSVRFFDGATDLGAADSFTAATGVATKAVILNAAASPHYITATFTPTDTLYAASTSSIVNYVVLPANYGTAGIPVQAQDNTAPYAGNLSLQVVAGTAVALAQVDPATAAGHPVQATDPTGHRHAWVFNGNLGGVSVQDTRPSQPGWTVSGQASDFVNGATTVTAKNLGWGPALVAAGSDAEGAVHAGAAINPQLQVAASNGLTSPGGNLAQAPATAGLGTQNLSAALSLWIPDTSPTGTYASTLTLTLVSP